MHNRMIEQEKRYSKQKNLSIITRTIQETEIKISGIPTPGCDRLYQKPGPELYLLRLLEILRRSGGNAGVLRLLPQVHPDLCSHV